MFAGHLAASLIGKRLEPDAPLGLLIGAGFGLDLIWPLLLLAGVERVVIDPGNTAFTGFDFQYYPWSHSLTAAAVWSLLVFGLSLTFVRNRRVALVAGLLVLSHWVLDFVTHRPDLPLWPSGPVVGLGLWHSIAGTIAVEATLLIVSVILYLRISRPRDSVGRWALGSMVGLVTVLWLSGPWSPPPPNATAIALVTLALWLLPPWGQWIDRHRHRAAVAQP